MSTSEQILTGFGLVFSAFSYLLVPFQYPFMFNALLIVSIVSLPTSILSCYLVLKGWSLIGDAISHAVLPGIVVAYLLQIPLILGAFFSGMFCALATGFIAENSRIKQDTVMGVVFSGMFGFGIVLYTKITTNIHLDHILFGNMLGVNFSDIWTSSIIGVSVFMFIFLKKRDFLLHSFDPIQGQAIGLSSRFLHYSMLCSVTLTIIATLSVVGIILSIGLLILPGAIAFLLSKNFEKMILIAIFVTLVSSITGVLLSFYIDSAPAPTIILILTAIFILSFMSNINKNKQKEITS